jgi:hypothetical protein
VGKLQERYGIAKEEAQRKADEWLHHVAMESTGTPKTQMGRP